MSIREFMRKNYLHFNARETVAAAEAWCELLDGGGFQAGLRLLARGVHLDEDVEAATLLPQPPVQPDGSRSRIDFDNSAAIFAQRLAYIRSDNINACNI